MTMARELAKRSHDPTYRVGALVVTRENTQVLSLGYNGNAPGLPHERESMAPGESGFIHAEVNALIKMDFNHPANKVMYVTLSPCRMCAKLILSAKIDEVVFCEEYRDRGGIVLLQRKGVKVRQFNPDEVVDAPRPAKIAVQRVDSHVIILDGVRYATTRDGKVATRPDGARGPYILRDNEIQIGFCTDGSPFVADRDEPADDYK